MTDAQMIWTFGILALMGLAFFVWGFIATMAEFERKLGRDLTKGEVVLSGVAISVIPSGCLIALIYVWGVMPEAPRPESAEEW